MEVIKLEKADDINMTTYQKDVRYIQKEEMAQQVNDANSYVKFSSVLKAVANIGLTREQYMDYWARRYKSDKELQKLIMEEVEKKLTIGIIPREVMIEKIRNSKDFESEKRKAIKALGGTYNG